MRVLVTGATGYIGGRLVPRLLELGCVVRILARDASRTKGRPWADRVEVWQGDLLEPSTLKGVFEGIDAAYYLVHSMYTGEGFDLLDRRAALNFCEAADGLSHVVYLGGLLPKNPESRKHTSTHLHSRAEIGRILGADLPTTEIRAGPIIGSGSASFEFLRYVTERVPVMFAPSWVRNSVWPIAVRDVLSYLVLALECGPSGVVEIGSERLTYEEMMLGYARIRGLKRLIVPIPPFLPTWFGAGWVGLVTPVPATLAGPLIESMEQPLVANGERARALFPGIEPIGYAEAVRRALRRMEKRTVQTHWSGTGVAAHSPEYEHIDSEGLIREVRVRHVAAPPETVFEVFTGLGGDRRWPAWNWAWTARGIIDRLIGGPGLRRGRRHPDELLEGEALDCWRVESVDSPNRLRLRAEMKLPGRAWLQWETEREGKGSRLIQTAAFEPRGLVGALYWYSLYPFHKLIFTDMIRGIGRRADSMTTVETVAEPQPDVASGKPPAAPQNAIGDAVAFLLHKPGTRTQVRFATAAERESYSERILQRIGIDVTRYSVLNLHKVGINAPVHHVFEELLNWNGNSTCWPNHIATVDRKDGRLEHIEIRPLGLGLPPLFDLRAIEIRRVPGESDPDNARYLLYECGGGYPIGIFVLYVRSRIASQDETESTQAFLGVGFDFYGKGKWPLFHPINRVWESVHNRVTSNVLNRFKQLCEWKFARTRSGLSTPKNSADRETISDL